MSSASGSEPRSPDSNASVVGLHELARRGDPADVSEGVPGDTLSSISADDDYLDSCNAPNESKEQSSDTGSLYDDDDELPSSRVAPHAPSTAMKGRGNAEPKRASAKGQEDACALAASKMKDFDKSVLFTRFFTNTYITPPEAIVLLGDPIEFDSVQAMSAFVQTRSIKNEHWSRVMPRHITVLKGCVGRKQRLPFGGCAKGDDCVIFWQRWSVERLRANARYATENPISLSVDAKKRVRRALAEKNGDVFRTHWTLASKLLGVRELPPHAYFTLEADDKYSWVAAEMECKTTVESTFLYYRCFVRAPPDASEAQLEVQESDRRCLMHICKPIAEQVQLRLRKSHRHELPSCIDEWRFSGMPQVDPSLPQNNWPLLSKHRLPTAFVRTESTPRYVRRAGGATTTTSAAPPACAITGEKRSATLAFAPDAAPGVSGADDELPQVQQPELNADVVTEDDEADEECDACPEAPASAPASTPVETARSEPAASPPAESGSVGLPTAASPEGDVAQAGLPPQYHIRTVLVRDAARTHVTVLAGSPPCVMIVEYE